MMIELINSMDLEVNNDSFVVSIYGNRFRVRRGPVVRTSGSQAEVPEICPQSVYKRHCTEKSPV